MTNREMIEEYIRGEKALNAYSHVAYKGDEFVNYSTTLCKLDREHMTAYVNIRKYSTTTSKIQNYLKDELRANGWTIEEYDGDPCYYWNCGYMGAPSITKSDVRTW